MSNITWFITGGSSGYGLALARYALGRGYNVVATARSIAKLTALTAIAPDRVLAQKLDVTVTADADNAVKAAVARFGRIDVLINNAGIYPRQNFLEMTEQQWDEMQDINLKSMFHSMKAVLPHMVAQKSGKIVNISSVTFHLGMATLSHYVASKGGVIGLTRSLAREMGPYDIHINCITPGAIKTAAEASVVTDEQAAQFLASQSLQRRIMPIDVARVCLFLSCELSDGMTGQVLNVDGGWVMH